MEWLELASVTSWQLSWLCLSQLKWWLRWQWCGSASIHTGYGYGFSQVLARAATTLEQGFPTARLPMAVLPMAVLPCHGFELAQLFSKDALYGLKLPHIISKEVLPMA